MADNKIPVTIGKGGLSKVIAKIGESTDLSTGLYFGYDKDLGSGVVVAGGHVVSSKILNLTATDSDSVTGVKTIEVTYLDTTAATGKTTSSFEVVSVDGVNSIINGIVAEGLITAASNGAVTVTPTVDGDGKTTFAIGVNVDGSSVKVNGDGNIAVDTYTLTEKAASEVGTDNVAEYVFTTAHADGTDSTSVTIEIPKAKAIQTAGLVKYAKGSDLTTEQQTALGSDYDADAYYCVNLDTDTPSKVDALPSNVTAGETYLHFVWGGDAGETNMAASELAVNYAGSTYIDVADNTISLKYDDLAAKLVTDYSIDKVAALDASVSDIDSRVSTLEDIVTGTGEDSIDAKLEKVDASINAVKADIETADASINAIETAQATADASINAIETAQATTDASVNALEASQTAADASINAIEAAQETADASINTIESEIADIDSSIAEIKDLVDTDVEDLSTKIAGNTSNITVINSSINNIYDRLTWVDLDDEA